MSYTPNPIIKPCYHYHTETDEQEGVEFCVDCKSVVHAWEGTNEAT